MEPYSYDKNRYDIDFNRLREDLVDEFCAQSVAFSGGFGFLEMSEVKEASNSKLIEIAKREGIDINKYCR